MKKKNIINKLIVAPLVMGFMSCTGNYMDINSNPYQPGDLTPDDYALGSAMSNLASTVISSDVNTAQFTDCLLGGPLGGYFADSNAGWSNTISNFNATNDWTRVFLISDRIISTLYGNLSTVKQVSENTNNPVPYAIAQIIKVAAMSRVTDAYGPIPYSKIGQDGKITIPYDTQEEVYNAFFKELDESIEVLTENRNAALVASADFVYSGNVQKWVKFANSLKLRIAMRMSYVAPEDAKKYAEEAVGHVIGVMTSNNDNAFIAYSKNPIEVMWNAYGDTRVCAEIIAYMNGYEDPRREKYFQKTTAFDENGYYGVRTGVSLALTSGSYLDCSAPKVATADPLMWMNAAECYFLRAEGAMRGWDMNGMDAKTAYETGISMSFAQYGLAGQEVAYMNDDTKVPATYVDPLNSANNEQINSSITVKWDDAASEEEKLERIITQKWIAIWPLGTEAWAEQRRTGYPAFLNVKVNNSGDGALSVDLASRVPFPPSEALNNTAFYNDAVQKLGGADNYSTKLWWDKKNN